MAIARQLDWRLAFGLGASLIVHLAVAAVLGSVPGAGSRPDQAPPDPDLAEPEIRPGLDRSRAVTISWIGFEDPTPHEAPLSATDQPFLARGPAPTPALESIPTPVSPPPAPPPLSLAEAADASAIPALPLPPATLDEILARLEATIPAPATVPTETPQEAPESTSTSEAPPTEDQPKPASTSGGGPREAAPTSQTEPVEIHPGRPVAVEGLEIDTVRPQFSAATRYLSYPSNPLVRVVFNTAGEVVTAEIVKTSGFTHVDRPVLDAIYAWKAKGVKLEEAREADPDRQIELNFRIVLR